MGNTVILYNYLLMVLAVAVILPSTPALLWSPFFRLETAHKKNISIRFHTSLHMQTKPNLYISCYHFYMHTHARAHTHTQTHTVIRDIPVDHKKQLSQNKQTNTPII